ncbi:MAG: ABC transporter ATP-binding protein [Gammaproteobacteria bacterium]|nr:ABC transporter ATP-binding protein [Gammaproteobacteria bacterium]NNC97193.1 ABC transporter ATP-binding protein [Gammaproteobacteria bacterium]NNM14497.1 ABC transporter ATP-binding protein [Gammaproteobacteria bacterium]
MSASSLIRCDKVSKIYQMGEQQVHALNNVSVEFKQGEMTAIMGPSGSGKSTLMNLLGALDTPSNGEIYFKEQNVSSLSGDQLADLRNETIGFVFQQFNLLSRATALKNVKLPLRYSRHNSSDHNARAQECLQLVGLGDRMDHKPTQLSGGQQQRVAIARALACKPSIILADEPTGALDTKTSVEIMNLLVDLNSQGTTVIIVTHEDEVAAYAQRQLHFRDGQIELDNR